MFANENEVFTIIVRLQDSNIILYVGKNRLQGHFILIAYLDVSFQCMKKLNFLRIF